MDVIDRALTAAVLTTKHGAFSSEDECRLVVVGAPGYSWSRSGRYGEQRIITLTAAGDDAEISEYSAARVSRLPIAKVMTGPWNSSADESWASKYLRAHGYNVPVIASNLPAR